MLILFDQSTPAPLRRKIAIVVIGNAQWRVLQLQVDRVVTAVNTVTPGSYVEVEIPSNHAV